MTTRSVRWSIPVDCMETPLLKATVAVAAVVSARSSPTLTMFGWPPVVRVPLMRTELRYLSPAKLQDHGLGRLRLAFAWTLRYCMVRRVTPWMRSWCTFMS